MAATGVEVESLRRRRHRLRAGPLAEAREELSCELARGRVDQPAAELRDLAADVRLDRVGEDRGVGAIRAECDVGAALGETGNAALALAADRVGVRRVEIGQLDGSLEARLHRP